MDTTTVLEIIKMLDVRMNDVSNTSRKEAEKTGTIDPYYVGQYDSLAQLHNHLQSFIEGQLNAAENKTGE